MRYLLLLKSWHFKRVVNFSGTYYCRLTTMSKPALGPTHPPIQWIPGALSLGVRRPGPFARMRGAIPPLPQYAFMEWCLVEAQRQLYLYLLPFTRRVGGWIDPRAGLDPVAKTKNPCITPPGNQNRVAIIIQSSCQLYDYQSETWGFMWNLRRKQKINTECVL